ncbi:MAG: PP2C family protein-serine/threonine phosphatase [Candidatus Methylacidiphilales bacterium]
MSEALRPDEVAAPMRVRWSGMTHPGKVRKNNEDSFLALTFNRETFHYLGKTGETSLEEHDLVFAVSDGMGGANAGEFASKIAVEKITRLLPKAFLSRAAGIQPGFTDLFELVYMEIHRALTYLGESYPECQGMGSTLTLTWLTPGWLYFAHLGDSRLYYLAANGDFKQLSEDHSHVGWLRRHGKINEREARDHPGRSSLQKALGAGHQFVDPQVGAVGLEPGDQFLLCTDGLVDGLWDRNIKGLLRDPDEREASQDPALRLVRKAVDVSGRDNTTALVMEIL